MLYLHSEKTKYNNLIIYDYLARTTLIVGAVVLINDDGILNVVHYNVLEENVPNEPIAWSGP